MQNCAKTSLFFGYKTLVLQKKRSKSTFQPLKVWSKWVCLERSWVDFECFYALLWRSWWLLNRFGIFLIKIWPFWGDFGVILNHFVVSIRGHFGVTLGSFGARFGIILGSFWCRFDLILRPFWALFGLFLDHFWAILAHFYGHFAVFFSDVLRNWLQN